VIVYGDPQYTMSRAEARERVNEYFARASTGEIDAARDLVIALGHLEQGIADMREGGGAQLAAIMRASDLAAEHFISTFFGKGGLPQVLAASRDCAQQGLEGDGELQIKIPEGFAFYSLYPEQYITAAENYISQRERGRTLVVGIRTIGTSLSAVVKAALLARGLPAERITVRPSGHPFARKTDLPGVTTPTAVIVVDEGPGLSGSSMASVAQAFRERGVTDITFFPSHGNKPGAAASGETVRIWNEIPSVVTPIFDGTPESIGFRTLKSATEKLCGTRASEVDDLSAGKWMNELKYSEGIFAVPAFERTKLRMRCENGRPILWKFAGVGPGPKLRSYSSDARARQERLAGGGWCAPVVAVEFGFIATEWIDGENARATDFDERVAAHLAGYIEAAAQPPLSRDETAQAIERLRWIIENNFREAGLEQSYAESILKLAKRSELEGLPAYGDGRVAPHEFIWSNERLVKADVWGHENDHTIVGGQPILWDVAGAVVEWNVTDLPKFLSAFRTIRVTTEQLEFFIPAYLEFRIGVCSMANNFEGVEYYKRAVRYYLGRS
jgi:hypothetical protein